jgi:ADP-ribosylglycohydrolase
MVTHLAGLPLAARPTITGALPADYREKVYAGVLGKIIGVYIGRPIEGWLYDRIMREVGEVDHYLKDLRGAPLIVTDDDITGTFTFLRALEDEGYSADLEPEKVGDNWLNYTIERRTIFWWGGVGNSAEHTAYERLKSGVKAPMSGSCALNGKVISEQIGSQIFIDGWGMIAPGDPEFAAHIARRAASVSHDGEAIFGAQVIAAMVAQAFVERDIDRLLDTGLSVIPADSTIARVIHDVRAWHAAEPDWRKTREQIAAHYGYDKFLGACHMVPNHALIILALLYGNGDFSRSQMIVNTAGWDTDCNAANVGCILGIRDGLATFDGGYDWRGPVADRLYLPTADGSRGISDALIEAERVVAAASALRAIPYVAPKNGARFHFSQPGSVQGFQTDATGAPATVSNASGTALRIDAAGGGVARVLTPTFIPEEALAMPGYELISSPSLYSGQQLTAVVQNRGAAAVALRLAYRSYGAANASVVTTGATTTVAPGASATLAWQVPDTGGLPIHAVGLELDGAATIELDSLTWSGAPTATFTRPAVEGATLWRKAWVESVHHFEARFWEPFRISQNTGRGILSQGTEDWEDYTVGSVITPYLAKNVGVAARVRGARRYYALLIGNDQRARLVKMDDAEQVLAEAPFAWDVFQPCSFDLTVSGDQIVGVVTGASGTVRLMASDPGSRLCCGGIGFIIEEGTMGSEAIAIRPV